MANYQLGPVIGKIGGGVDETPVSVTGRNGNGTNHLLAEVDAGEGATVVVSGRASLSPGSTRDSSPSLIVGETQSPSFPVGDYGAGASVGAGAVRVYLRTDSGYSSSSLDFSGHVYVIPFPD